MRSPGLRDTRTAEGNRNDQKGRKSCYKCHRNLHLMKIYALRRSPDGLLLRRGLAAVSVVLWQSTPQ